MSTPPPSHMDSSVSSRDEIWFLRVSSNLNCTILLYRSKNGNFPCGYNAKIANSTFFSAASYTITLFSRNTSTSLVSLPQERDVIIYLSIFRVIDPSVQLFLIGFYYTPTTAHCLHNLQHVSTALHGHHQGVKCRQ
jgi:hypothetical protein